AEPHVSAADVPLDSGTSTSGETQTGGLSGKTAWARNLEAPLRDFLRTQSGSAAILLAAAVAALVWANIGSSYDHVWHTTLTIQIGGAGISQDLRHWVNNGLLTFFFFVTG